MVNSIKKVLIICTVLALIFYTHLRKIKSERDVQAAQITSKKDTLFLPKKEDSTEYENTSTTELYSRKIDSNARVSVDFVNADFRSVMDSIERLTTYHFGYSPVYLPYTHKITFRATNITPEGLLKQIILREKMLEFTIYNDHSVIFHGNDRLIRLVKANMKD